MAERHSAGGVGGLPFTVNPKASPSSPPPSSPSPSPHSHPSSTPPAESTLSPSPLRPPPHLGPGGLPLPPQLALPPSSHPPRIRGWGEKLMYETGTSYALGFATGGLAGTLQGVARPLPGANAKLRLNAVLNGGGRLSSQYANGFAVFALMYSMGRSVSRWGYRKWIGEVGQVGYLPRDDWFEGIGVGIAGTMTGMTRMGAGRAMVCGGVLGVMMVGGLKARRQYIDQRGVKVPHI